MRIIISSVVEQSTYHAAEFDFLKIERGSLGLNIVVSASEILDPLIHNFFLVLCVVCCLAYN